MESTTLWSVTGATMVSISAAKVLRCVGLRRGIVGTTTVRWWVVVVVGWSDTCPFTWPALLLFRFGGQKSQKVGVLNKHGINHHQPKPNYPWCNQFILCTTRQAAENHGGTLCCDFSTPHPVVLFPMGQ